MVWFLDDKAYPLKQGSDQRKAEACLPLILYPEACSGGGSIDWRERQHPNRSQAIDIGGPVTYCKRHTMYQLKGGSRPLVASI